MKRALLFACASLLLVAGNIWPRPLIEEHPAAVTDCFADNTDHPTQMDAAAFAAAITWARSYGGVAEDGYASGEPVVEQTSDGNYIFAAGTRSFGSGQGDVWLVKLDPWGNVLWQQTYGTSADEASAMVQQTSDGGYILLGEVYSADSDDAWVLKLDGSGNVIWQKNYGASGIYQEPVVIHETSTGYMIAGLYAATASSDYDAWVMALASSGNVIWQKTYPGGSNDDFATDVREVSGGGYIVSAIKDFHSGADDGWLLRLDGAGNVVWQKTFGGLGAERLGSVLQTSDGGFITAGYTNSFGAGSFDAWVLKLDASGIVQWQNTYGGSGDDRGIGIVKTSDGGYAVSGRTQSFGAGLYDAWLFKLDSSGNIVWQKSYGGTNYDSAVWLQETADLGFVTSGDTKSFGAGGNDAWILKVTANGDLGTCSLFADSSATTAATSVTGVDIAVTPVTRAAPPSATSVAPLISQAMALEQCGSCPLIILAPSSLPDGTVGTSYSFTLSGAGGVAPYTFAVTGGALPAGLALDAGGNLTGTPTTAGSFPFTVTATDANGCSGSQNYSINISSITCSSITVFPVSLPDGTSGTVYNQTVGASGGTAPYAFSITSGNLPPGLALDPSGPLAGTPTTAGTFSFTVTAIDVDLCTGNRAYTLNILNPSCSVITLSPVSLPSGSVGTSYDQTITASGGTVPYTFTYTGSLPPGLSLDSVSGVLSGTPVSPGSFSFLVTATDSAGCSGTSSYSIDINPASCPAITISPSTVPSGHAGTVYTVNVIATGGSGTYTYSVTNGALPPGLVLYSSGLLIGIPTTQGTFTFTVTAVDTNGCSGSQDYIVTIVSCLFCDDFNDAALSPNWGYLKGTWTEGGGSLKGTSVRKAVAVASPAFAGCSACSVEAISATAGGIGNRLWILAWYQNKDNTIELMMKQETGRWILKQRAGGRIVTKKKAIGTINPNVFYDVVISFDGSTFTVSVDGTAIITMPKSAGSAPFGTVGFQAKATTGSFDQILVN